MAGVACGLLDHVQQHPSQVEPLRPVRARHVRGELIGRGDRRDRLAAPLAGFHVEGNQIFWIVVDRAPKVPIRVVDDLAIPLGRRLAEQCSPEPAILDNSEMLEQSRKCQSEAASWYSSGRGRRPSTFMSIVARK